MNREDFPMINTGYIYLDNGATTWKSNKVIESITDYYTKYTANAHRGDYDLSLKVDSEYESTREVVRRFINAKRKEEIVFTSGTTDSLNIIAEGYFKNKLKKDDEIIITYSEHASNVLPWFRLQNEIGAKVIFCPLNENHEVTIENIKKTITDKTKVISLAHITNVIGDVRPIKDICKIAHEKNILVVVDGAQSIPHLKTDVEDLDLDFLAFSGHKMTGPTGIGVLYAKYDLLNDIKPINLGGGMNEEFDTPETIELKPVPTRLEAGTPNIEGVVGLKAAIEYLEAIGMDKIHQHELELKELLITELKQLPHVTVYNDKTTSGVVAFNVDGIFAQDVAVYLNKYKVCVRAGNHCAKVLKNEIKVANTVRASIYLYNTKEEILKLVELLRNKDKIIKEML